MDASTQGAAPARIRLSEGNLPRLPASIAVPGYDRHGLVQSIVHVGVGGFFRAHQAVYLDDLLRGGGHRGWRYCGVGLLAQDSRMRDALRPQDGLYTVVERSAGGDRPRVIGSLLGYLLAADDAEAVVEKMASPECRTASLAITEGGYYVNEATGAFSDAHPDVVHDVAHPRTPRCSFGFLVEAQRRRRLRGLAPFTVMSCDNVRHNGAVARRALMAFAERSDPTLAEWLAEHGAFPSSMVDRITPVTTDEHRQMLRDMTGVEDAWPVFTEPFIQWVVEDVFPTGRPAWERVGVQMTADVAPYEKTKMRLLNASHQAMCYIGMLLGYEYAHETMEDPQIRSLVERMMDEEITPLLRAPPGIDLAAYKRTLVERFSNPTIRDQLSRIGTEGSARIPGFVLPSIAEQVERGGPFRLLGFTVACWFRYLTGTDDAGREMPVIDPMRDRLMEHARRGGPDPLVLLGLSDLFGEDLVSSPAFCAALTEALGSLHEHGARATLAAYVGEG